jgi:hypothetical protein
MHPLSTKEYSSSQEIENKILELNKKYFMTNNPDLQMQIGMMLDTLKATLEEKRLEEKRNQQNNNDSGLDNLINVS